mmetsp:Transcript_14889/g.27939  ORF Transcript_14889/g.27939 Transcript_14889/m.27939 type:complete len:149 (+) Transcript_14889:76-522(+)
MGQRVCMCCLQREAQFQELPRLPFDGRKTASEDKLPCSTGPGLSTGVCLVCREAGANTLCLPCGHLLVCHRCSLRYALPDGSVHPDARCPTCKVSVKSFQRVFFQTASTLARLNQIERSRSLATSSEVAPGRLSFASRQVVPSHQYRT